jgi:hypothetical protein
MARTFEDYLRTKLQNNRFYVISVMVVVGLGAIISLSLSIHNVATTFGWIRTGDVLKEITAAFSALSDSTTELGQMIAIDRLVRIAEQNEDECGIIASRLADWVRGGSCRSSRGVTPCDSLRQDPDLGSVPLKTLLARYDTPGPVQYAVQKLGEDPLVGHWGTETEPRLNLRGVVLVETRLANRRYPNVDWDSGVFLSCELSEAALTSCNLTAVALVGGKADRLEVKDSSLEQALVMIGEANGVRLESCKFRGASFLGCRLSGLVLSNAAGFDSTMWVGTTVAGSHLPPDYVKVIEDTGGEVPAVTRPR